MGSMSIWHWLIVLVVVLVVFGTKKLASAGKDVGTGIRNFKDAMREGQTDGEQQVATIRQNLGVATPPPVAPPPAAPAATVVEDIAPTNAGAGAGTPPGGVPRA